MHPTLRVHSTNSSYSSIIREPVANYPRANQALPSLSCVALGKLLCLSEFGFLIY
jgi:hypothetical protein